MVAGPGFFENSTRELIHSQATAKQDDNTIIVIHNSIDQGYPMIKSETSFVHDITWQTELELHSQSSLIG